MSMGDNGRSSSTRLAITCPPYFPYAGLRIASRRCAGGWRCCCIAVTWGYGQASRPAVALQARRQDTTRRPAYPTGWPGSGSATAASDSAGRRQGSLDRSGNASYKYEVIVASIADRRRAGPLAGGFGFARAEDAPGKWFRERTPDETLHRPFRCCPDHVLKRLRRPGRTARK